MDDAVRVAMLGVGVMLSAVGVLTSMVSVLERRKRSRMFWVAGHHRRLRRPVSELARVAALTAPDEADLHRGLLASGVRRLY